MEDSKNLPAEGVNNAPVEGGEETLASLEQKIAAMKAERTTRGSAESDAIAELRRFTAANRADARQRELDQMGLESPRDPVTGQPLLTKAQMMALVPDVDPREPAGVAALAAWKAEHRHLFRAEEPATVTNCRANLNEIQRRTPNAMFSVERAMKSLGTPKPRR